MRSLPPKDYELMPLLDSPAGYICVIRDIDSDRFRIDNTGHPAAFVNAIMDEAGRKFGIEIVSILETEDLRASESELYERHHARLSADWHALDAYQLAELRRSMLQIDAHRSFYLTRQRIQEPAPAMPSDETSYGRLMTSKRALRRDHPQPPLSRSYGLKSLARNKPRARQRPQPLDLGQYLRDRFLTLLINHPFKVIFALALLLVLGLVLGLMYGYHVTHNYTWR